MLKDLDVKSPELLLPVCENLHQDIVSRGYLASVGFGELEGSFSEVGGRM